MKQCIRCLHYNEHYGKCMKKNVKMKADEEHTCFLCMDDINIKAENLHTMYESDLEKFNYFLHSEIGKETLRMLDEIDKEQVYQGDYVNM